MLVRRQAVESGSAYTVGVFNRYSSRPLTFSWCESLVKAFSLTSSYLVSTSWVSRRFFEVHTYVCLRACGLDKGQLVPSHCQKSYLCLLRTGISCFSGIHYRWQGWCREHNSDKNFNNFFFIKSYVYIFHICKLGSGGPKFEAILSSCHVFVFIH